MSTVIARQERAVAADPRMAAFLAPGCPEVFHFPTRAHGHDLGYCGYLQMTAEAGNFARYISAT